MTNPQHLVRTDTEIKELLLALRIRFSWTCIALQDDIDKMADDFAKMVMQDPTILYYSVNSFGAQKN